MSEDVLAVWCCSQCGAVYHKDFPRCPNDGAEVVLAMRDPLLDQTVAHYVIDRLIGEGGMGRVYAAHHATLTTKRYAIKVLLGDVAATLSMRKRFTQEAESASQLDHPNVVHVIDYGSMPSGLPYIVMDYVDGRALTDLIDHPMEPARVIRLARAVCEGLSYAHEAGVIHRDLKPDNVMVVIGPDGREVPRIADFGLATTMEQRSSRITTTGMAMGTPAYAAPEQMAGKRVDHKADLYSLGLTMFEMLTGGKLPFDGHPLTVMTAKSQHEAPTLREVMPELEIVLPNGLEDLVAQLIRRRSVDRPQSARDVIAALDRISAGTVEPSREKVGTRAADRALKYMRTGKVGRPETRVGWIATVASVAVLGAGVGWWWQTSQADRSTSAVAAAMPSPAPAAVNAPPPVASPQPALASASVVAPVASPPLPSTPVATPAPTTPPVEPSQPLRSEPIVTAPHRSHPKHLAHKREPKSVAVATAPHAPVPLVDVPAPPTPVVAPPPPPAAIPLVTHVGVEVQGALSPAIVKSAVDRVVPALALCAPTTPQTVSVHFTIGEARRAETVRGSGAPAATIRCVVAAIGGVRSDSAPDVGDAKVDVTVGFVAK